MDEFGSIKLIALDLDGTLVCSDDTISKTSVAVLTKAKEEGYWITILTGRHVRALEKVNPYLEVNAPVVCLNGAQIASADGKVIYFQKCMNETSIRQIVEIMVHLNIHFMVRGIEEELYSPERHPDLNFNKAETMKIIIHCDDEEKVDILRKHCEKDKYIQFVQSGKRLYEIGPKDVNKGTGLKKLLELLHIQKEECLCFGDYDNDIPAFQQAGISVCMSNGGENAKHHAHYICPSNDEDGVAKFVERYVLKETTWI